MEEKDTLEFSLEDIIKEFGGEASPTPEDTSEEVTLEQEHEQEAAREPEEEKTEQPAPVTGDTIRLDATIRLDSIPDTKGTVRNAVPVAEEEPEQAQPEQAEAFSTSWEPEYEQPMGDYVPPQPIIFHPRSRLRELKRKLVAGPEKKYYELSEKGLGKLQAAIFLSLLVVLISAGSTVMYAMGMVQENRLRLMVFGQFLALLVSALLGSQQLIAGAADLLRKRFSLNTLLVFTFIACCVDGVFCLSQLRVPCCAAFSLEVTMSLWNAYHRRNTDIGMMDTMRKATHLDSICVRPDYLDGKKGFLRGEGQVEDFMDTYHSRSRQEKALSVYALIALFCAIAIGVVAGLRKASVSVGFQVTAVSLLAAMPATMLITLSRPLAVLERRLHRLGAVLCGWQGVEALCGKAVFPVDHEDLFPAGCVKMNGVKFYGDREPDRIVAYATALMEAGGSGLASLFVQVLDSRNGRHYDVKNFRVYENGGIGGEICGESVLAGTLSFLKEMGVEVPEGIRVSNAVCVSVDGELSGLFAISYEKDKSSAAGISTLCSYRGLQPVLSAGDFMLTGGFLRAIFGIKPKRVCIPDHEVRAELARKEVPEDAPACLLVTSQGLAPFAYSVTGARVLKSAADLGVTVHMIGGILGLGMMLALAVLGAVELLTPANMFLYELVWMIPGLLITEWTRSI